MCICTHTYRQPPAPRVLYTGSARDRQMGSLSRVSPTHHSESYILLKEEGAGEKKKAGVWSVLTGFFLIPHPRTETLIFSGRCVASLILLRAGGVQGEGCFC